MKRQLAVPQTYVPPGEDFLLLPPTEQAFAYRNVDRMFATRTISRGDVSREMPRSPEILPAYRSGQEMRSVDAFISRNCVAGLLIVKDGHIVLERYALGLTAETRWSSMSTVKSLTSTLVGAAIQDGAIRSLDDAVSSYVPELAGSAYDKVRIRHLLTMSSGVKWNEDYTDRSSDVNRYSKSLGDKVPGGVLKLMRSLPAVHAPGAVFNYNTGDTYVLGCVISAATGKNLAHYMSEKFWTPLGMEFDAYYTLESEGGQEIGGSRAGIALRDFGRFGIFLLGDGTHDGKRILPPDWLDQAGKAHFELDPAENPLGATGYGFSWWLTADKAMVAAGFAGQSLYVNRAEKLVIVTLSCLPQPPFDAAYGIDFKAEAGAFRQAVVDGLHK